MNRSLIRSCPFSNPPYSSPWTNLDGECECQKHRCFSIFQADTNFLYFSGKKRGPKNEVRNVSPKPSQNGAILGGILGPPKMGSPFLGPGPDELRPLKKRNTPTLFPLPASPGSRGIKFDSPQTLPKMSQFWDPKMSRFWDPFWEASKLIFFIFFPRRSPHAIKCAKRLGSYPGTGLAARSQTRPIAP